MRCNIGCKGNHLIQTYLAISEKETSGRFGFFALLKEVAADFLAPRKDTLIKKGVFLHFRLKGTIKKGSWLL